MKKLSVLLFLTLTLSGYAIDWQQYQIDRNAGGINFKGPGKKTIAFYSSTHSSANLDAALEPGYAVLKVTSLQAKEIVKVRFNIFRDLPPDGSRIAVKITLQAPGVQKCQMVMDGRVDPVAAERQKVNVNFWKCSNRSLSPEREIISSETDLPDGLKDFSLWIDLTAPGEYRIYDCVIEPAKRQVLSLKPGSNHVLNGGAERGFYGTGCYHFDYVKMHDSGLLERFNRENHKYSATIGVAIDNEEKHSGDCSFRLTAPKRSLGFLMFNPVPFANHESAYLSCWMKAERKCGVRIGMFLANGVSYEKRVIVTSEWQRYECVIPEWGKDAPGIVRIGDPGHSYSASVPFCSPSFEPEEGSIVWVDDVFYSVGVTQGDYRQERPVTAGVALDHPSGIYRPGEDVKATLTLRNVTDEEHKATIAWTMRDFNGTNFPSSTTEQMVTLAAHTVQTVPVTVRPANALRGPLNLVFDVNGETTGAYFGVLDVPATPDPRLSVNVSWETNIDKAITWFREFRIGTVRTWGQLRDWKYFGMRYATPLHQAGIRNLYVVAAPEGETYLPKDRSAWFQELAKHIDAHRGEIAIYEFLNEYNLWRTRKKVPDENRFTAATPEAYVEALADFHRLLKEHDPQALIAGPTPCGTDISFILNILRLGAAKHLDMVTEHAYRSIPECPDYDDDLRKLQKGAAEFGEFRFAQTEAGACKLPMLPDNLIEKYGRNKAAKDTRNMIIAWANGLDHYSHFLFCFAPRGCDWNVALLGNGDTGFQPQPSVALYAYRTAADRLNGSRCVERLKLGGEYRCYIFDRGDRRVATIWKWKGTPAQMTFTPELRKNAEVYAFTGSLVATDEISLGEFPFYIETSANAAALRQMLTASPREEMTDPLTLETIPLGGRNFAVYLINDGSRFLDGFITVNGEKREFARLGPEERKEFSFVAARPVSVDSQPISATVTLKDRPEPRKFSAELRALLVARAPRPLTIDGDLTDWPTSAITVPLEEIGKLPGWGVAEDATSAETRFCWDDDHLYCAVIVHKKGHFPADNSGSLWKGDGLQMAFDTLRNATKDQKGFQDDDFEYDFALMANGPIVNRARGSSSVHDSLGKRVGVVDDVPFAAKVLPDRTVYEVAFPRAAVSPFRLQVGSSMRVNVLANIANDKGRIGYRQLTRGIGDHKRPGEFIDIILLDGK